MSSINGSQSVRTLYLGVYFPSPYSWNKAKLSISSAWWGENYVKTLNGTLKGGRGRLIEIFKFSFFSAIISGL